MTRARAMKKTTYAVKPNGKRLLDDFRGDRIYGDRYIIIKDGEDRYEVMFSTFGEVCDCLGFMHVGKCKHVQMVFDYLAQQEK
jgi:hypothetical protein